jgi:small subunit ribosomal protein S17
MFMSTEKPVRVDVRKEFVGEVVSDKMKKTIVVLVTRLVRHGQYEKTIRTKAKFKAHDEKNEAHIGDKVRIRETRPMSRDKRWRLVSIISKAKFAEVAHDI